MQMAYVTKLVKMPLFLKVCPNPEVSFESKKKFFLSIFEIPALLL